MTGGDPLCWVPEDVKKRNPERAQHQEGVHWRKAVIQGPLERYSGAERGLRAKGRMSGAWDAVI